MKIVGYVLAILAATGILIGAYFSWKSTIERAAEDRLARQQLAVALDQATQSHAELMEIIKRTNEIMLELELEKEEIQRRLDEALEGIDGMEDRESSEVLKEMIRRLR